jgi:transcriptional regulator with XRE-family HTH domain
MNIMGRKSKLKLPPLSLDNETFGQRLSRLRKKKGLTQVELGEKIGIPQTLITDYERDKLRPYHEMIIRFAMALGVSTDELLGVKPSKKEGDKPSLKIIRRIKKIETLPVAQQKILFKTIDTFIRAAEK